MPGQSHTGSRSGHSSPGCWNSSGLCELWPPWGETKHGLRCTAHASSFPPLYTFKKNAHRNTFLIQSSKAQHKSELDRHTQWEMTVNTSVMKQMWPTLFGWRTFGRPQGSRSLCKWDTPWAKELPSTMSSSQLITLRVRYSCREEELQGRCQFGKALSNQLNSIQFNSIHSIQFNSFQSWLLKFLPMDAGRFKCLTSHTQRKYYRELTYTESAERDQRSMVEKLVGFRDLNLNLRGKEPVILPGCSCWI